jgi:hypothetical protein
MTTPVAVRSLRDWTSAKGPRAGAVRLALGRTTAHQEGEGFSNGLLPNTPRRLSWLIGWHCDQPLPARKRKESELCEVGAEAQRPPLPTNRSRLRRKGDEAGIGWLV